MTTAQKRFARINIRPLVKTAAEALDRAKLFDANLSKDLGEALEVARTRLWRFHDRLGEFANTPEAQLLNDQARLDREAAERLLAENPELAAGPSMGVKIPLVAISPLMAGLTVQQAKLVKRLEASRIGSKAHTKISAELAGIAKIEAQLTAGQEDESAA